MLLVRSFSLHSYSSINSCSAAVHGQQIKSTGSLTMKRIFREQEKFFDNFPVDKNGSPLPLTDFESMPHRQLIKWRDHLLESFSSTPPSDAFRFKTRDGALPSLSTLKMGGKAPSSSHRSSRKAEKIKRANKPQQRHRRFTKLLTRNGSTEEESMSDAEDTSSDGSDTEKPPPRSPKAKRESAQQAKRKSKGFLDMEQKLQDDQAAQKKKLQSSSRLDNSHKSLPGSLEQRLKKQQKQPAEEYDKEDTWMDSNRSMFLQTKGMTTSTLPDAWKRKAFNPKRVSCSSHFMIYKM